MGEAGEGEVAVLRQIGKGEWGVAGRSRGGRGEEKGITKRFLSG